MGNQKIIVIEGLDGSGKSTQISLLINRFKKEKIKFRYIHFPIMNGESFYGDMVAQFLRGEFGKIDEVHPKLVSLLFAENRNEYRHLLEEEGPNSSGLNDVDIVLLDRYINSNIAYQCAKMEDSSKREELKKWILNLEYNQMGLPKPDLSIYLHMPLDFIEKNLKENDKRKGGDRDYLNGQKDIHESDIDFQRRVHTEYRKLIYEQENFEELNCWSPEYIDREGIHSKIWNLLKVNNIFVD